MSMRKRRANDNYLYEVALTAEELAADRASAKADALKMFKLDIQQFTCDNCKISQFCSLAFDPYNTHGDCLLDK